MDALASGGEEGRGTLRKALAKKVLNWEQKVGRAEGLKITYEYFKSLPEHVLYEREHKSFDKYVR